MNLSMARAMKLPALQSTTQLPTSSQRLIREFQHILEHCADRDAQRAYELGHQEGLRKLAERFISRGYEVKNVEEFTKLPRKDVFSLENAQELVEEEVLATPTVEWSGARKFRIPPDQFEKYIERITVYTVIPLIQREKLSNYNSGRWYDQKKATTNHTDQDLLEQARDALTAAWEKKTGRKLPTEDLYPIIPISMSGPITWWNVFSTNRSSHRKIDKVSPFNISKTLAP